MFESGRFEVRRRRTPEGFRYRVEGAADGAVLVATVLPHRLDRDLSLESMDGDSVLRVTPDVSGVDEDLSPGPLGLAFAVRDARARDARTRESDPVRGTGADGESGDVVGLVRREMRSLYRRHWSLLDPYGLATATVVERSRLLAVARRRFTRLVPYRYAVRADGESVGRLDGRVVRGYVLDVDPDAVDPRLALGGSLVVDSVELTA